MATGAHLYYLKHLEKVHFKNRKIDLDKIDKITSYMESVSKTFFYTSPSFFILDYTSREYIKLINYNALSLGYSTEDFLHGGLDFWMDIFQKDDFLCVNHYIFSTVLKFFKSHPQEEHDKYIFTHNFRLKKKDGTYAAILTKRSFITSKTTGLPLISFGMDINISSIKHDTRMVHTIDKIEKDGMLKNISTDSYYPMPEESILSKREIEILRWMSEGLSSKQLADKLFLSENTIANHRKNILHKTNCKNVAELIKMAVVNGII